MVVSPAVKQLIAEQDALSAVLACVEGRGDREEAKRLTEEALQGHEGGSLEAILTRYAMERIVGRSHAPLPEVELEKEPFERHLFETTALAWLLWLTRVQQLDQAQEGLRQLLEDGGYQPQGGALHLMALRPWQLAVEALLTGDPQEARRLFRRATEIGSQCGTETNPAVQWTYGATFFLV
jgi:hypothetical protein